ncbi:MAG: helix-turn-helix transcriptional regulator [Negativicutes bacterium]|nr:helix-turn-helix transcriptional regulator [Negativicutes bacterium]
MGKTSGRQLTPGQIVRILRGNMTQGGFGKEIGCGHQHVSDMERGRLRITEKMAWRLIEISGGEYKLEDFLRR